MATLRDPEKEPADNPQSESMHQDARCQPGSKRAPDAPPQAKRMRQDEQCPPASASESPDPDNCPELNE